MKQRKGRIISSAILFSVILAGVCVVWWGYASQYQKILGTSPFSPMLQKPSPCIGLYRFDRRLTAGIFVFLFRKKLPFFQLRTAVAGSRTTLVVILAMDWARESEFPCILAFLSPLSMRYLFISQSRAHWTDVYLSLILTCMLCGILLSVLIVRKQVHWSWTAVRMTILANVFAIGTIHGGMLTLYPYVLEVLIEILIAEQIIQGIQRWIEK